MKSTTKRATATERFHAEAAKKRAHPLALLFIGIGVIFVAVVGFILFGGGEPREALRARFDAIKAAGAELQMGDRHDDASAKYREAIALVEGDETFRSDLADLRARLREIAERKAGLKEALVRFDAWKAKVERRRPEELNELVLQGRRLLSDVEKAGVPWRPELKGEVEALEKERDGRETANPPFEVVRERIRAKFLAPRDWGGAVGAWKAWLPTEWGRKEGKRGEEEIAKVHQWAREESDGIRRKARRLADSGEKAAA
ncbi:MAG TPA: hypothetical protein VJB14_08110, partial [Planctomycetota bacterium]|nr:hypothetical protein [Planctomycetota bacterium]